MKKMVLGLVLALAALGLMASPAMAAPDSPRTVPMLSAADQAFLATLAKAPAPVPAAKRPSQGLEKSACNATANCWDGTTRSCSGNTSCSAVDSNCSGGQRGSVTCDGVTTQCPSCCPDLDCTAERASCASDCAGCPFIFSCNTSTCNVTCHCKFSGCF